MFFVIMSSLTFELQYTYAALRSSTLHTQSMTFMMMMRRRRRRRIMIMMMMRRRRRIMIMMMMMMAVGDVCTNQHRSPKLIRFTLCPRSDKVTLRNAIKYPDQGDHFEREPYSALFHTTQSSEYFIVVLFVVVVCCLFSGCCVCFLVVVVVVVVVVLGGGGLGGVFVVSGGVCVCGGGGGGIRKGGGGGNLKKKKIYLVYLLFASFSQLLIYLFTDMLRSQAAPPHTLHIHISRIFVVSI